MAAQTTTATPNQATAGQVDPRIPKIELDAVENEEDSFSVPPAPPMPPVPPAPPTNTVPGTNQSGNQQTPPETQNPTATPLPQTNTQPINTEGTQNSGGQPTTATPGQTASDTIQNSQVADTRESPLTAIRGIRDAIVRGVAEQLDKPYPQLAQEYINRNFAKGDVLKPEELTTQENIQKLVDFGNLNEGAQRRALMTEGNEYRELFKKFVPYYGEDAIVFDDKGKPALAANTYAKTMQLIEAGDGSMYIGLVKDLNSKDPKKAATAKGVMDNLFANYTKEQKDALESKLQSKIWSGVWSNPLENLPVVIGMFLRNHGLEGLAGFAENPWCFWLSSLAILFGGGMLLGNMLDGDDEPRQQMNPGWTTIPYT